MPKKKKTFDTHARTLTLDYESNRKSNINAIKRYDIVPLQFANGTEIYTSRQTKREKQSKMHKHKYVIRYTYITSNISEHIFNYSTNKNKNKNKKRYTPTAVEKSISFATCIHLAIWINDDSIYVLYRMWDNSELTERVHTFSRRQYWSTDHRPKYRHF